MAHDTHSGIFESQLVYEYHLNSFLVMDICTNFVKRLVLLSSMIQETYRAVDDLYLVEWIEW